MDIVLLKTIGEIVASAMERKRTVEMVEKERNQLLSVFSSIDQVIYISDMDTHEILYANEALCRAFDKDLVGGICYREFQGFDEPCEFCTNEIIRKKKYG